MSKPILCVDFDGVIHSYTSPWTNAATISDGPVPGALRWLWKATEFFNVMVYSSRSKSNDGIDAMHNWMRSESIKEFGEDHPMSTRSADRSSYPITFCHEKPAAFLTIDDRAICFDGDWSKLHPEDLIKFKPWNKRESPAADIEADAAQRLIRVAKALAYDANKSHLTQYVARDPVTLDFKILYRSTEEVEVWLDGAWPAFADLAATVIKASDGASK
jgi:hypothetical protein